MLNNRKFSENGSRLIICINHSTNDDDNTNIPEICMKKGR